MSAICWLISPVIFWRLVDGLVGNPCRCLVVIGRGSV
jgi:hypothetical protein